MITSTLVELFLRTALPNMLLFRSADVLLWGVVIFGALVEIKYAEQKKTQRWIFLRLALAAVLCEVFISLLFRYSWRAALRIYSGVAIVEYCLLSALLGACAVCMLRFFKNRDS